jgi:hypothetical protein
MSTEKLANDFSIMNKEFKSLTGTGTGEIFNSLTREDIYKYGTREEIEFLTEMIGGLAAEYLNVVRALHKYSDLEKQFKKELEIIMAHFRNNSLSKWINESPEANEYLEEFKNALKIREGGLYKGAFATSK